MSIVETITAEITSLDIPNEVPINEPIALRFAIRCPDSSDGVLQLTEVNCKTPSPCDINNDLFQQGISLGPGEIYYCTFPVTFRQLGVFNISEFYIQPGDQPLIWFPAHPIRVVPSLAKEIDVQVQRICGYELGTKAEVTLTHRGQTLFQNLSVTIAPTEHLRAGLSNRLIANFQPGAEARFDVVIDDDEIVLNLDAIHDGQPLGTVSTTYSVAGIDTDSGQKPFRFIEFRRLTHDNIRVYRTDPLNQNEILPVGGAFPLEGSGKQYRLLITPTHPNTIQVDLSSISGQVEVDPQPSTNSTSEFLIVVVKDELTTHLIRLYYDVVTTEGIFRGEIYLSIRPTKWKWFKVAAAIGIAVTMKSFIALGAILWTEQDPLEGVMQEFFTFTWENGLKLVSLISIPIIFMILWGYDIGAQIIQDE